MSIEDLIKKLNQEYLATLPHKISSIETLCAQADIPGLRDAFHKLKGTGRTYGLPEISDLAEILEKICVERPEHAVTASNRGLCLLKDVFQSRTQGYTFALNEDPRFAEVRNALNH